MKTPLYILILIVALFSCGEKGGTDNQSKETKDKEVTAQEILGNKEYQAISYGGYRKNSRDIQPTVEEVKEDMKILYAMGIRILRTYNVHLDHASTALEAIHQLKNEDSDFEMYVMLGAWMDCKGAWTDAPDHDDENVKTNSREINRAVALTNQYPDIVKIIAVGNEAMVKWAASYYVQPWVILKWVNHLQELKENGTLPADLWITSSDNFASWGGGEEIYHVEDLNKLYEAVDFVSVHTYPMHDTHYNPDFWGISDEESELEMEKAIEAAMQRALTYAQSQYNSVVTYMKSLGVDKPVHIGETGWATGSNGFYGPEGSRATDEYKESLYYSLTRNWTDRDGISCFYFEAFDESWKDAGNPGGSENFFGLLDINGQAKYALWDDVEAGKFQGLTRGGNPIVKTYGGDKSKMMEEVLMPRIKETVE